MMTPEERAELDRLLDLAEKEQLLRRVPEAGDVEETAEARNERLALAAALQEKAEAERQHRAALVLSPATRELKWGDPDEDDRFD